MVSRLALGEAGTLARTGEGVAGLTGRCQAPPRPQGPALPRVPVPPKLSTPAPPAVPGHSPLSGWLVSAQLLLKTWFVKLTRLTEGAEQHRTGSELVSTARGAGRAHGRQALSCPMRRLPRRPRHHYAIPPHPGLPDPQPLLAWLAAGSSCGSACPRHLSHCLFARVLIKPPSSRQPA